MKKLDLFTQSIYQFDNFLDDDTCNDIFKYIKQSNEPTSIHGALTGSEDISTHGHTDNIIDSLEMGPKSCYILSFKIQDVLNKCAKDLQLNDDVVLTNSWYNIQQRGSTLNRHNHSNSIFSGAIFINTDESSSKLYFYNPNSIVNYFCGYNGTNSNNANNYSVLPQKGTLYVFPSYLDHGSHTDKNNTKDRVVLSFNSKLKNG